MVFRKYRRASVAMAVKMKILGRDVDKLNIKSIKYLRVLIVI
jgi:hypothetical protein